MNISLYDVAGTFGALLIVAAYFATQARWLTAQDWFFPLANLVGALLILISLAADWNLPSFVMEAFWLAISIYGLYRALPRPG